MAFGSLIMDRMRIFDTIDDTGGNGTTMVFRAGEIKKQLDPSFQSVEDISVAMPLDMELMKVYLRIRPFTKLECRFGENQVRYLFLKPILDLMV